MKINLIDGQEDDVSDWKDALDASGVVGAWGWNPSADTCRLDRGAARLLAGNENLAGQEISRAIATAAIHPADASWHSNEMNRLARYGGVCLSEYRVMRPKSEVRWLLSRGTIYLDDQGRPIKGNGILIDITETRDPGRGAVTIPDPAHDGDIEGAVTHAIAALQAVQHDGTDALVTLGRAFLMELGHELARRIKQRRSGA